VAIEFGIDVPINPAPAEAGGAKVQTVLGKMSDRAKKTTADFERMVAAIDKVAAAAARDEAIASGTMKAFSAEMQKPLDKLGVLDKSMEELHFSSIVEGLSKSEKETRKLGTATDDLIKKEKGLDDISGKRIKKMLSGMEQLNVKTIALGLGFGLVAKAAFSAFQFIEDKAVEGIKQIPKAIEALADYSVDRDLVGLTGDDRELTRLVNIKNKVRKEFEELGKVFLDTSHKAGTMDRRIADLGIKMRAQTADAILPLVRAGAELAATFDTNIAVKLRDQQATYELHQAQATLFNLYRSGRITFDEYLDSLDAVAERTENLRSINEALERLKPWSALAADFSTLTDGTTSEVAAFARRRAAVEKYLQSVAKLQALGNKITSEQFEAAKADFFRQAMADAEGIVLTSGGGGGGGRNPIKELREEFDQLQLSMDPVLGATAEYEGKLALLDKAHKKLRVPMETIREIQGQLALAYRDRLNPELAEAEELSRRLAEVNQDRLRQSLDDVKRSAEEATAAIAAANARQRAQEAVAGIGAGSRGLGDLRADVVRAYAEVDWAVTQAEILGTAEAWNAVTAAAGQATSATNAFNEAVRRTTVEGGAADGWARIKAEVGDIGTLVSDHMVEAWHMAEEALLDFFQTGQIEGDKFLQQLTRMTLQLGIRGLLGSFQTGGSFTVPGFQTGGSFMVRGRGGIDSQPVMFRATPGERVIIQTPGQQRRGDQQGSGGGVTVVNHFNANDFAMAAMSAMSSAGGRQVIRNEVMGMMPHVERALRSRR